MSAEFSRFTLGGMIHEEEFQDIPGPHLLEFQEVRVPVEGRTLDECLSTALARAREYFGPNSVLKLKPFQARWSGAYQRFVGYVVVVCEGPAPGKEAEEWTKLTPEMSVQTSDLDPGEKGTATAPALSTESLNRMSIGEYDRVRAIARDLQQFERQHGPVRDDPQA